jgi:hypothetical protein
VLFLNFIHYNIIIIIIIIIIITIIIIIIAFNFIIVRIIIIIIIIIVHTDQITHQDNQTVTLDDIIQDAGTLAENARGKSPRLVDRDGSAGCACTFAALAFADSSYHTHRHKYATEKKTFGAKAEGLYMGHLRKHARAWQARKEGVTPIARIAPVRKEGPDLLR